MYGAPASRSDSSRDPLSLEQRSPYYDGAPRSMGIRQPVELPRPIEPHPVQQMNGTGSHSFHDERSRSMHTPNGHPNQSYRLSGPTLPGLRDILSPVSRPSPQQMQSAWAPGPVLTQGGEHRSQDVGPQGELRSHPPYAVQAPQDPRRGYPDMHERAPDSQYVEPHHMRPAQPPPISPYGPFSANGRDYMEARLDRQRQQSTSSYITHSVTSPYTPLISEELAQRGSIVSHDRLGNPPFTPTGGPEASRKYLGIKDYPEGSYHVYEGGFRIPTHVDGDTVNPQWGLTKANKPRKRLALACLDCREKKIKCEPGASSCLQCEKAKRVCRRAPNQPSSTEGASTSWSSAGSPPQSRPSERVSDPTPQTAHGIDQDAIARHGASAQENAAKRHAQDDPLAHGAIAKKHRSASPVIPSGHTRAPMQSYPSLASTAAAPLTQISDHSRFEWKVDPYFIDPATTMRMLDLYFAHVNNATYNMFPQHAFLTWVTHARKEGEQCQNERMVLYAMLAMGSVFAGPEAVALGERCAQIASQAAAGKLGSFGLPLVQTRLILSYYNFAKGTDGLSWDLCSLAVSALMALRYNEEEGCSVSEDGRRPESYVYGFTKEQIAECRRRTFWSGFLMDRYNGLLGGMCCMINTGDIHLRLPCQDDMFENSRRSEAPFYNNRIVDPADAILTAASPVTPMAWLVLISAIWGDAMAFIHRGSTHDQNTYRAAYERTYGEIETALKGWSSRLPDHMQYSYGNLERAIQGDYAGVFISIHTMYHFILLKLSRCLRHSLAPDIVPRNIQAAHKSAHQVLRIMCDLQASRRNITQPVPGQSPTFTFSTPFAGYATVSAIDIVGAGGPESNLGPTLDGIAGGTDCLSELSQFWHSANKQLSLGRHRLYQLKNVVSRPFKALSGCWLGRHWGFEGPIDDDIHTGSDCIYGIDEKIYFAALEETTGKQKPPSGSVRIG